MRDLMTFELRPVAKSIVAELAYLPLAIVQAGACIASGVCYIKDYLETYSEHRKELLSDPSFAEASNCDRAVYTTWDVSYMAIEAKTMGSQPTQAQAAKSAILILEIFAFLHHQSITEEIFKRAAEAPKPTMYNNDIDPSGLLQPAMDNLPSQLLQLNKKGKWDTFPFRQGIQMLMSFSLIKQDASEGSYSVHPLVHSWSRDRIPLPEQERKNKASRALLAYSVTYEFSADDYAFRQTLIPHVNASTAEVCNPTQYHIDECVNLALVLYENGNWVKSEKLEIHVVETRKRVLGTEHPDTAQQHCQLGSNILESGEVERSRGTVCSSCRNKKEGAGDRTSQKHSAALPTWPQQYWSQGRWKKQRNWLFKF
jgi:hypothetical protein